MLAHARIPPAQVEVEHSRQPAYNGHAFEIVELTASRLPVA